MLKDIKNKAKKNYKPKPSFEIMDVSEAEKEKGEKIAAYQARKAEEARQQQQLLEEEERK